MNGHELRLVWEDGRIVTAELDGLDLKLALDGVEVRARQGIPHVRLDPLCDKVVIEADDVALERLGTQIAGARDDEQMAVHYRGRPDVEKLILEDTGDGVALDMDRWPERIEAAGTLLHRASELEHVWWSPPWETLEGAPGKLEFDLLNGAATYRPVLYEAARDVWTLDFVGGSVEGEAEGGDGDDATA